MDKAQAIINRVKHRLEQQTAAAKKYSTKLLSNSDCAGLFLQATAALTPPGKTFVIDAENKEVINTLIYYFNSDPAFTGDPCRGLLLRGNVGSGKTHLLRVFELMGLRPFVFTTSRQVEQALHTAGPEALRTYTRKTIPAPGGERAYPVYCFDDLGAEANVKSYGNEFNVMAEVIQDRYDLWKTQGVQTHFSTNLTRAEIEAKYGDRCLSRLQEMCNFITLGNGAESTDRRVNK